jgi:hypothetical protein
MDVETPEILKTQVNQITPSTANNPVIYCKTRDDTRFTLPDQPKGPNPNATRGPKRSEHPSASLPRATIQAAPLTILQRDW